VTKATPQGKEGRLKFDYEGAVSDLALLSVVSGMGV
jgi:hypothetical protein